MKNLLLTFILLLAGFLSLSAQEIHSPAEIFEIMEKSPITYELNELEDEILPPDRTDNLNFNSYYRVIEDGQIFTYRYQVDSIAQEYLKSAEKFFEDRMFSAAKEMYIEALRSDSTSYWVMTYIGQMCGIEGDFDQAIDWYKKAISLNFIDYMAHWFLADAYKEQGKMDEAVDEITIAMILNRNNPRIKESFNDIYRRKKLELSDWTFTPQMQLDSIGKNKVGVSFDADWLGYALVKALWRYEPGYQESMGVEAGSFSTIEEKEAFVSLMTGFDRKTVKKHPEFRALKASLDKDMIDEFIFYEIVLPEHPFVAYQLSEEFINQIKDYVIAVRGDQK
ncbi:tetratricopeptide repeat protein [Marinilabilia salmonicolor]|uniref:tetratricopeptide repeat protein n=1 Tax=Marinilabilia salmonicolor TaxID=989 RepID=UPI00029AD9A7|nr:tetratricopeptide repeat protein [Marinilabilia salmonicolor]